MYRSMHFAPIILVDLNKPWERVLSEGTHVAFEAKNIVSCATSDSDNAGMYYIKKGCIRLSNIGFDGQEKIMLYMGKGTLFNEVPMLQYATGYIFTATEYTESVFWPKKRITTVFIKEHPDLLLNLLESMSRKSKEFYSQLSSIRNMDTFTNVCRILCSMHLYNQRNGKIVPRLTQQEFAAFLGVHRSSLHKALFRLQKEGIIGHYSRTEFDVYDLKRLFAYAEAGGQ